jgi:hypothetical protein
MVITGSRRTMSQLDPSRPLSVRDPESILDLGIERNPVQLSSERRSIRGRDIQEPKLK